MNNGDPNTKNAAEVVYSRIKEELVSKNVLNRDNIIIRSTIKSSLRRIQQLIHDFIQSFIH